jgi:hypothetical protein
MVEGGAKESQNCFHWLHLYPSPALIKWGRCSSLTSRWISNLNILAPTTWDHAQTDKQQHTGPHALGEQQCNIRVQDQVHQQSSTDTASNKQCTQVQCTLLLPDWATGEFLLDDNNQTQEEIVSKALNLFSSKDWIGFHGS